MTHGISLIERLAPLIVIGAGCLVALLGNPLAGGMLMLGYEVGRAKASQ